MSANSAALLKVEPLSPFSNETTIWLPDDETFYQTFDDQLNDDNVKFEVDTFPSSHNESKVDVAALVLEDLENLIDLDELIKEENFLLDEPILEDIPKLDQPHLPSRVQNTQQLLKEFETVYDAIELNDALTPPQSPPTTLTTLQPLLSAYVDPKPPFFTTASSFLLPQTIDYAAVLSPLTPQADIAHELAVVDELVRTRVEDMQWSSGASSRSGPSSPGSLSSSSNFGDCSSGAEDHDWSPNANESEGERGRSKRSKPYARGNGDKKTRKKEQNKNAATRYRMKKKAEVEVILSEEKQLAMKNDKLEEKITDMQREVKYLKGLMRDLFKAKGLIN